MYNWKGGKINQRKIAKERYMKIKYGLSSPLPIDFLKRVLLAQENKCFYCERDLTDYKAIEHLTPLSRGGENEQYNLVYACQSCNSRKNKKTLEEYAIENKRFDWIEKFDLIYASSIN